MTAPPRSGDARQYPPDALALFASYRDRRLPYRPLECTDTAPCWVELGPPGAGHAGRCLGCGGAPLRLVRPR